MTVLCGFIDRLRPADKLRLRETDLRPALTSSHIPWTHVPRADTINLQTAHPATRFVRVLDDWRDDSDVKRLRCEIGTEVRTSGNGGYIVKELLP